MFRNLLNAMFNFSARIAMRWFMACFAVVMCGLVFASTGVRAEMVVKNSHIIIGNDYSVFRMKRNATEEDCSKACAKDKRCEAWTYVRAMKNGRAQCRLKRAGSSSIPNACCVSGIKKNEFRNKFADGKESKRKAHMTVVKACDNWAADAVKANEENQANRCGYRGEAWHSNAERHFSRCMRLGPKQRAVESKGKQQALSACAEELGYSKKARCDHYSKVAVQQNESRRKADCVADRSDIWSGNYKTHYAYCADVSKKDAMERQSMREAQLQRCFALEDQKTGPCHDYAKVAIEQFRKNVAKGCDLHGPSWHNNYRRHLGWCRQASPKVRFEEIKQRKRTLKACRFLGKFGIKWR